MKPQSKKRRRTQPIPPWATEDPDQFNRELALWSNRNFRSWLADANARVRSFEHAAGWS